MDVIEFLTQLSERVKLPVDTLMSYKLNELQDIVKRVYGKQLVITLEDKLN